MWKSGSVCVFLILLFGSGNGFTMERGSATVECLKKCEVPEFNDWYSVGKFCVQYFNTTLNFTQAEFTCRSKAPGAHLVSVHSIQENHELFHIVQKHNPNNPNNLRIWLGGFELFKSGKFMWLDGSFWSYDNWVDGEPNNIYKNDEECVEMNWKENEKWNDAGCFNTKSFICAFKMPNMLEADWE